MRKYNWHLKWCGSICELSYSLSLLKKFGFNILSLKGSSEIELCLAIWRLPYKLKRIPFGDLVNIIESYTIMLTQVLQSKQCPPELPRNHVEYSKASYGDFY